MNQFQKYPVLLNQTFDIFKNNINDFLKVIFALEIPIALITYYSFEYLIVPSPGNKIIIASSWILLVLIIIFISMIPFISICMVTYGAISNQKYSLKQLLNESLHNLIPCFWANLIATIKIACGLILFIIPGIKWSIDYSFVPIVTLMKKIEGGKSLDYSQNLISQSWWFVFGASSFFIIISAGLSLLQDGVIPAIPKNNFNTIILESINLIVGVLFQICIMILYVDFDKAN